MQLNPARLRWFWIAFVATVVVADIASTYARYRYYTVSLGQQATIDDVFMLASFLLLPSCILGLIVALLVERFMDGSRHR